MQHLNGLPKVLDGLFPSGERDESFKLYAIMDASRNEVLYDKILDMATYKRCLFEKAEKRELDDVAPWLAAVNLDAPLLEWIVEKGFGKNWGVFLLSKSVPKTLVAHYRKLTEIRDRTGKSYLFRYYDPRVLRLFLNVCSPAERNYMLYPARNFIMENEEGNGWITFAATHGAGSVIPVFGKKQEEAFSRRLVRKFEERMIEEIKIQFPDKFKGPGRENKFHHLICQSINKAADYGIRETDNLVSYIKHIFKFGLDFEMANSEKAINQILKDERLNENAKIGLVTEFVNMEKTR